MDFESVLILLKDGSSADLKPKTKSNTAPTNTTDTIPQWNTYGILNIEVKGSMLFVVELNASSKKN